MNRKQDIGIAVSSYREFRLRPSQNSCFAGPPPGGMMHLGIPAYPLPRKDLMREIERIKAMGVEIVVNHKVAHVLAEKAAGNFDAVFIAIGAGVGKHVDILTRDARRTEIQRFGLAQWICAFS